MRIEVGKYTLCSDQYCCWIEEKVEVKKGRNAGEFRERRVTGYATSLRNLLRSFRDKKIMGSDAESIEELINALKACMDDMLNLNKAAVESGFTIMRETDE